jgi:hypothetical protein
MGSRNKSSAMAIGPQSQHGFRQVRRKPGGDCLLPAMIK